MYLWQHADWPAMHWNDSALSKLLVTVCREQGKLLGEFQALGFQLRSEAHLRTLTEDVVKSSEIEGESLPREMVRSSVARRLGIDTGGLVPSNRDVDGIVELMIDATDNYAEPLTEDRLFSWHAALFPTGQSGLTKIRVAQWRDDSRGPMQVVSGPMEREKLHYEAPPARHLTAEMSRFLSWFEQPGDFDPLLVAGLAHLWFVTIHPFDDGNGRIARAIADMALARSEKSGQRFYSVSAEIRRQHRSYYQTLETAQKGTLDITGWQYWFLQCLDSAIANSRDALATVINKARFWERFASEAMNDRQIKILNQLHDGFEGKLTTSKWAKIAKCSQDTAYRDILALMKKGALKKDPAGGRSTSYSLADI